MITTNGTYHVIICDTDIPLRLTGDCKTFEVMTSIQPLGILGSVASLFVASHIKKIIIGNYKLWKVGSTERYTPYTGAVGMLLHTN